ncbi:hypothetical protein GJ629_07735 [Halapricum sp. CBA1109]|nr:hypothetical protein [Halapricum sp. CBA1109]
MAGAVTSLFAGVSIGNAAAAKDVPMDPDKEITELTKSEKQDLFSDAKSDSRIRAIRKKIMSEGLKPDKKSMVGYRTTFEDKEWKFIRIPFTQKGRNSLNLDDDGDTRKKGAIIWNTADEIDPHGYVTTTEVDYNADTDEVDSELRKAGVEIQSVETDPVVVEHRQFSASNAKTVKEESNSVAFPVARGRQVSTQGCACNSALANPLTACAPCGIPDTGCISDLASTYALEVVACGACVASAGWLTFSCASCLATLLEEDDLGFFCCPCDACDGWLIC